MHILKPMIIIALAIGALTAQADTLITMKEGSGSPGADGQLSAEAKEAGRVVKIWSRPDNMARVDDSGKMIFSIDRGVTYMISDSNRTCRAFNHPKDTEAKPVADDAIEVRQLGETRKIGPWQAEGYDMKVTVEGMSDPLQVAFWVTDDVTMGLETYRANFSAMATPQTAWMSKTLELGGYPVYQESRIGQMMMWSEVLSVSDEDAPAGTYEVPEGYTGCDS